MQRVFRYGWPGGPDHRLVIHPSRGKQVLEVVALLPFSLFSGWLLVTGVTGVTGLIAAGILGLLATAALGTLAVARLVDRRPALVLDRNGLYDNATVAGAGLVRWSEMTAVGALDLGGRRTLCIGLRDPEALLARVAPVRQQLIRTRMRQVGPVVTIPQNVLPLPVDDLVAEMRTFLPAR